MKRATIALIAVFFFLALTGLITIQLYWIKNAIEITDQEFRMLANKALESVVLDLEENELIKRIAEEIDPASSDSITAIVPANSPLARKLRGYQPNSKLLEIYGLNDPDEPIAITGTGQKIYISDESLNDYPGDEYNETSQQVMNAELTGRVSNKIVILETIMDKILYNPPNIRERINPEDLKPMLRNALSNVGINLEFEYSIRSGQYGDLWKTPGFNNKPEQTNSLFSFSPMILYPARISWFYIAFRNNNINSIK
jgi:hypothetical protein